MHCASDDEHCVLQLAVLSTHVAPFSHRPALQFSFTVQLLPAYPTGHTTLVEVVVEDDKALVLDVVVLVVDVLLMLDELPRADDVVEMG